MPNEMSGPEQDGTITVICGRCKKPMGTKPADGSGVSGISHSTCDECRKVERDELDKARAALGLPPKKR